MEGPLDGTDTFNLYDIAALAHLELMEDRAFVPATAVARMQSTPAAVLEDLRDQLSAAERVAAHDPFGIGYTYENDDTISHLLGLLSQAEFDGGPVPWFRPRGRRAFGYGKSEEVLA